MEAVMGAMQDEMNRYEAQWEEFQHPTDGGDGESGSNPALGVNVDYVRDLEWDPDTGILRILYGNANLIAQEDVEVPLELAVLNRTGFVVNGVEDTGNQLLLKGRYYRTGDTTDVTNGSIKILDYGDCD